MKRVLLITSKFKEQDSVASISENIFCAFKSLSSIKVDRFAIEENWKSPNTSYDFIAIIHPVAILNPQLKTIIASEDSTFLFYTFGDFFRKSAFYIQLNDVLMGKRVHFFSPSKAHAALLKKAIVNTNSIGVIPHPLNPRVFNTSNSNRNEFRKKHNLNPEDIALIYTGRISPQKNILELIQVFHETKKNLCNKKVKLFLYGNIDEFEAPTFYEKKYRPGEYFQQLKNLLASDSDVIFRPRTNQAELKRAYAGCDLFISLSLYHDEEFGYSPIEALINGTPVILSDWGGFRDLKNLGLNHSVNMIPVEFHEMTLQMEPEKILIQILKNPPPPRLSKKEIRLIKKRYSYNNISKFYFQNLQNAPSVFNGFTDAFISTSLSFLSSNEFVSSYEYFYKSFWSDEC